LVHNALAGGDGATGDRRKLVCTTTNRMRLQSYAVGGNQRAARLTGIKVNRVLLFVYGVSGWLAGLANMSYCWQLVVKGLVIIVAVTVDRLRRRGAL